MSDRYDDETTINRLTLLLQQVGKQRDDALYTIDRVQAAADQLHESIFDTWSHRDAYLYAERIIREALIR